MAVRAAQRGERMRFYNRLRWRETAFGWLFISPLVLGLILFQFGPVVGSLALSFHKWDILRPLWEQEWVGAANYVELLTADKLYVKSLGVTAYYSLLAIPTSIVVTYSVALLLNQKVQGMAVYRTLWYLPAIVPVTSSGLLFSWMLQNEFGPINYFIRLTGLPAPNWLGDPNWTVPTLVLIHVWQSGTAMLIFLAGLQAVPQHLYEAAEIDGAGRWMKLWNVTIPMTSPIIFFNLVIGIIYSFQVFNIVFIIFTPTSVYEQPAGPEDAGLVYIMYLYRYAFQYFQIGYASAMAWLLLLIVLALTLVVFRSSGRWVYYEAVPSR